MLLKDSILQLKFTPWDHTEEELKLAVMYVLILKINIII